MHKQILAYYIHSLKLRFYIKPIVFINVFINLNNNKP